MGDYVVVAKILTLAPERSTAFDISRQSYDQFNIRQVSERPAWQPLQNGDYVTVC